MREAGNNPEYVGNMFHYYVGWLSVDYKALYVSLYRHRCENLKSCTFT
jgi:hypothetical protein